MIGIRQYTSMIVLQSAKNEETLEVLYNALMVTKSCSSIAVDNRK